MIAMHDVVDTSMAPGDLQGVSLVIDYDCDSAAYHMIRCLTHDTDIDNDDLHNASDGQCADKCLSIAYRVRHGCDNVKNGSRKSSKGQRSIVSLFETDKPMRVELRHSDSKRNNSKVSHVFTLRDPAV